jgi:hypothetical protein
MNPLITALVGQPKNVGVVVAALLTAGQLRSEEYCAQAAECQGSPTAGPILSNSSTKSWLVSGGHSPSRPIDNRAALTPEIDVCRDQALLNREVAAATTPFPQGAKVP